MSPSILPEMDEAQLVELNNGTVMANLRNNHKWVFKYVDNRVIFVQCQLA